MYLLFLNLALFSHTILIVLFQNKALFWINKIIFTYFTCINIFLEKTIGPVFQPDVIQFADALPKTRSGKIMRRILKAIASGTEIGNVTTLVDPLVVDILLEERKKMDVEVG